MGCCIPKERSISRCFQSSAERAVLNRSYEIGLGRVGALDIEYPSPRGKVGNHTAENGAEHKGDAEGDAVHGANQARPVGRANLEKADLGHAVKTGAS